MRSLPRFRGILLLLALFGMTGLGAGCGSDGGAGGDAAGRPDLILITVDTLRQDRLSCYGYERETSPHIDRLAADSIRFTNATTPRTSTAPSLASTMTGLYPHKHGVHTNFTQVHPSLTTLPEVLLEAGYRTAGFISNYVLIRDLSNLQSGFELYDDFVTEREPNRDIYERKGEETVESAVRWLEAQDEPFFLWLHLMDPHGPYLPPKPYDEKFGPGEPRLISMAKIPSYQRLNTASSGRGGDTRAPANATEYLDAYDGEIAYCDAQIGKFLDRVRDLGLYDDAVILFHADHGESLGEHDKWFAHGHDVSEGCAKIPFLVKPPKSLDGVEAPAVSEVSVSGLDVMPTLLELAGLSAPDAIDGRSVLDRLAAGEDADELILLDHSGVTRSQAHVAVRDGQYKLVYEVDARNGLQVLRKRFYRIDEDPAETRDLFRQGGERLTTMTERLDGWLAKIRAHRLGFQPKLYRPPSGKEFIKGREGSDDHRDALKKLGYIE